MNEMITAKIVSYSICIEHADWTATRAGYTVSTSKEQRKRKTKNYVHVPIKDISNNCALYKYYNNAHNKHIYYIFSQRKFDITMLIFLQLEI
jgi:hypothetical protein